MLFIALAPESYAQAISLIDATPDGTISYNSTVPYITRSEPITINHAAFSPDTVNITLFGETFTIHKESQVSKSQGYDVWKGSGEFASARFIIEGNIVTGEVSTQGKTYMITSYSSDIHHALDIDMSAFPPEHLPDNTVAQRNIGMNDPMIRQLEEAYIGGRDYRTDKITIDVYVAYTDNAKDEHLSDLRGNLESSITNAIDNANNAYENNDLPLEINFAQHSYRYEEEGIIDDLEQLVQHEDNPKFARIFTEAVQRDADIIILVGNYTITSRPDENPPPRVPNDPEQVYGGGEVDCAKAQMTLARDAESAFAVVSHHCLFGHSLAYVIGQLQGAGPNYDYQDDVRSDRSDRPHKFNSEFPHGHGYYDLGSARNDSLSAGRTIMAQNHPDCDNPISSGFEICARQKLWSDPYQPFFGTTVSAGTPDRNWNAKVLFSTGPHIASLRGETVNYDTVRPTASVTIPDDSPRRGDTVTITATFDEEMHPWHPPYITFFDGSDFTTGIMTAVSDTVYTYSHLLTEEGDRVHILLSNARDMYGNPIVKNPTSGETFTVSGGITPTQSTQALDAQAYVEDDFEGGLSKWSNSGDSLWIDETPHTHISKSTRQNTALSSFDCNDLCIITLDVMLDTSLPLAIHFDRFIDNKVGNNEGLSVQYSIDGTNWTELASYSGHNDLNTHKWVPTTIDLTTDSGSVELRFVAKSSKYDEYVYVDNLRISNPAHAEPDIMMTPILNSNKDRIIVSFSQPFPNTLSVSDFEISHGTITGIANTGGSTRTLLVSGIPYDTVIVVTYTGPDIAVGGNFLNTGTRGTTNEISAPYMPVSISAPSDITAQVTCPGTSVNLGQATIPVSADPNTVITNNAPVRFSLGTAIVTWTATDSAGNQATDTQTVTIQDTMPPEISSPVDITQEATAPFTLISLILPEISENSCDVIIPTNNAPESFPVGVTTVTWTARDSAGNLSTATQMITIRDTTGPAITTPADITAEVTCPGTSVNLGQATATDDVDSSPTITSNSPAQFPLGTTTVIWTATDASGNTANATQTVTIRDTTNPVLGSIDNLVSEAITVNDYANMAPSVTDNSCDVIIPTHDAPESFPLGDTIVTWTATDTAGNSASITHTVTIQDVAPPIIMAPLDVISEVTCPGTSVSLGTAVTSDNYDPSPQIRHDAPDSFPVGTTTVIWTATDDSGNMATDEQLVTIRDTTKPVLGPIDNLASEPITVHDYANMAPSVTDNSCDIITPTHNAPESFPLGDTIVTWTATDMAGNSASTTHTVTIHTAQLIIMAPLDVTAEVTCPGTTVSLGMAAVSDNYDPSPEITNDAPYSFPLGTTTVTWTATDSAGTVATDTQQVTVRDTTAPGIRQVNDITQESTATLTQISLTAPGTVDNSCDVPTLTHDAPGSFPVGITVVTWTATDSSGNSAKAIQIITILGDGMPQPLQAYRIISNTLDDSNRSQDHSLVRLGDTFVLAHKNGGQGVIRSFDVSSDGRSITQLDALPHRSGLNEDMIQIGDNTLALVYAGNIDTLRVTDGDITPIKTHGIGSGYGPELVRLGHDTYALAYGYNSKSSDVSILRIPSHGNEVEHLDRVAHASTRTVNHNGVYMDSGIFVMAYSSLGGSNLVTFSVSPSNQISKLADMQYYPKKSFGTSVVAIDEDTVALGYTSLEGAYVKTYNVATNGTLSYVSQAKIIGSLSVDINIVHLSGQTYLAAYSDGGYGGWMRPLLIDNDGSITMGPAVMHDDQALYGSLVRADDDTAVFAYQGANSVSKIAILGVVTPEP